MPGVVLGLAHVHREADHFVEEVPLPSLRLLQLALLNPQNLNERFTFQFVFS